MMGIRYLELATKEMNAPLSMEAYFINESNDAKDEKAPKQSRLFTSAGMARCIRSLGVKEYDRMSNASVSAR
jgi:hypothetical protein